MVHLPPWLVMLVAAVVAVLFLRLGCLCQQRVDKDGTEAGVVGAGAGAGAGPALDGFITVSA